MQLIIAGIETISEHLGTIYPKILIMRRPYLPSIFLFFFLWISCCLGQTWEWQHPYPQGHWMNDIFFVDEYTGWVGGDGGTLMKTDDGGQHWDVMEFPSDLEIHAIYFVDKQIGFVCTDDFGFYHTQDGGNHWTLLDIGNKYIGGIHFLDPDIGFIIGYQYQKEERISFILRTQDGGMSWSQQIVIRDNWIKELSFVDALQGWACGGKGLILYTDNAGLNWQELPSPIDIDLRYISFIDAQNGWVAGSRGEHPYYESVIYHTSDGGLSWTEPTVFSDISLACFEFIDSNEGIVLGDKQNESGEWVDILYHTHDGGLNWQRNELAGLSLDNTGFVLDDHNWWMLGGFGATILYSQDGGLSWDYQIQPLTITHLGDVFFINDQEGWAVGHGIVLHTTNGGKSWPSVDPGFDGLWHTVFFVDQLHGWIVAGGYPLISFGISGGDFIVYHTSNGGQDWAELETPVETSQNRIFFTDPMHGWIIENSKNVWSTTNGGQDWQMQTLDNFGNNDLYFIDSKIGWLFNCRYGWYCSIAKTTDGGATWSYSEAKNYRGILSVHFTDSLNGWLLPMIDNRILYRTKDGGASWQEHMVPGKGVLLDLHFANERMGWVVGSLGQIWYTEDGGSNWTKQDSGKYFSLIGVYAVDEANAWAVGLAGTILKYTAKSTTAVDESGTIAKTDITIYPNPANNHLNIITSGSMSGFQAELCNSIGQQIEIHQVVGPQTRIDLQGLPPGLYLLNVYNGYKRFTKKVMVVGR